MDIDDSGAEPDTASTGWLQEAAIAAPVAVGQLPDGQACVVIGDVRRLAAFNRLQGNNPEHDGGDCGVVCCGEVLSQFGIELSEATLVEHATRCRELHVVAGHPEESGWTLPADQVAILQDFGIPARWASSQSNEQLADAIQDGRGVIAAVNAGVLWSDPSVLGHGQANHVVTVTGIAREPFDGALQGFFINDSGSGKAAQFVSAHLMTTAFVRSGGFCVITEASQPAVGRTAQLAG
jgi:peptidase C39-like protein